MKKPELDRIYDRQSSDLPINSRVAIRDVDDPLERGAKLKVVVSVRDDPLAAMLSRGVIQQWEFEAGRTWQRHHEHSTIGCLSAIDPTKEAVDGGRIPDVLTDRQQRAMRTIAEADKALGNRDSLYVRAILAERLTIAQCAARFGLVGARGENYMSRRFRDALDTLARLWGYRT